jgi:serine O-acetyltransferase
MNSLLIEDYERFTPHRFKILPFMVRYFRNHELRYIFWGRILANSNSYIVKLLSSCIIRHYRSIYGIEINFKNVGGGIRLIHPWCITVNDNAIIGKNVTLFKGCTIGVIETGLKKGNPVLGDNVTVYANATICGNIKIGNNVIISAGSFVNFDVPDNAIVIGNPGQIHHKIKLM